MVVCECGKGKFQPNHRVNSQSGGVALSQFRKDCFFRNEAFQYRYSPDELLEDSAQEFRSIMNSRLCVKEEWQSCFMIYDPELERDVSLWENIIYLCSGKCRNSFVAALLADLDNSFSPDKTASLSAIYEPTQGPD